MTDRHKITFDDLAGAISSVSGAPRDSIDPQSTLVGDLGLDSLALLELINVITEDYGVAVPTEPPGGWEGVTVRGMLDAGIP